MLKLSEIGPVGLLKLCDAPTEFTDFLLQLFFEQKTAHLVVTKTESFRALVSGVRVGIVYHGQVLPGHVVVFTFKL
ncbi:hypothetical protein HBA55_25120 [Pseudomaricurvus alkylphenolicus]|jgi:hypothetical protein|uniref:hypothetical protein n=1 Tax=Pseudomaricurvus alkylphenolicus TaxID=1306991 RepID=UPI00142132E7|nr:hypothetical protein [Pseudomaricurvus alkylphenolicus]NIB42913.1 hypothetical protein [Pseudomaricurvus alkylphenolicus]